MNWVFEQVSVGDDVARFSRGDLAKMKVERVTRARIFVGGYEYTRERGKRYGGGSWDWSSVAPWTEEHDKRLAEIAATKRFEHLQYRLSKFLWRGMSDEQTTAAVEALRAIGIDVDPETAP